MAEFFHHAGAGAGHVLLVGGARVLHAAGALGAGGVAAGERAGCIKEARATYQQEMAGARAQVMAERR